MFTSGSFWALVVVAAAVVRLLPDGAVRTRSAVLAAVGLAGASLVLDMPVATLALLAGVVTLVCLAATRADGGRWRAAAAVAGPVTMLWVLGKHGVAAGVGSTHVLLYFSGLSYLVVKAWTLGKDRADGRLPDYDPVIGAAYLLHLPTYLSGPMHTYAEFAAAVPRLYPLRMDALIDGSFRFLVGMVKTTVLAPLFTPVSLLALRDVADPSAGQLVAGAFGFSAVLYLDFSGYSDMAIAMSRLAGIDAPENFHRPYLAPNIREFWRRWHITFSRVLTAYVFVPLTRALQRRWPKASTPVMVVGYIATFALAGYWHGPTANYVVWGLYHAAGLIVYDRFRARQLQRRLAAGVTTPPPTTAVGSAGAALLTFTFVSLGWILFVRPLHFW